MISFNPSCTIDEVSDNSYHPTEHLILTVQKLSLARDLETVMYIVKHAARKLTQSDGATFILRDGGNCFYADEDAIAMENIQVYSELEKRLKDRTAELELTQLSNIFIKTGR